MGLIKTRMVGTELLVAAFAGALSAVVSLGVGITLWMYKRGRRKTVQHHERSRELENILKGSGESDTQITEGLLHLVEQHDKELDHAAEERSEMRRRIRRLEERAEDRTQRYENEERRFGPLRGEQREHTEE